MKKELGQFNTTRKDYILFGFESFVSGKSWVDPFAGNGDLLEWAQSHQAADVIGFDVDPVKRSDLISVRDTLRCPAIYEKLWVIANPPYLAKNKNATERAKGPDSLYEIYGQDDLYKIAIKTIAENGAEGGILIVPLNFLSSDYASSIRRIFSSRYRIVQCVAFEETVFDDTTYTVCAFSFVKRTEPSKVDQISVRFMPSDEEKMYSVSDENGWVLGEEFYEYIEGVDLSNIGRWTVENAVVAEGAYVKVYVNDFVQNTKLGKNGNVINGTTEVCLKPDVLDNIIVIYAIDTGSPEGQIRLDDIRKAASGDAQPVLLGLPTSRNLAHVRFVRSVDIKVQEMIIERVNARLAEFREKYRSVFLTAYRNSTGFCSRKRIGFEMMYALIERARQEIENERSNCVGTPK